MLQWYGRALWDEALISPDDERAVSAYAFLRAVVRRSLAIGGGEAPLSMRDRLAWATWRLCLAEGPASPARRSWHSADGPVRWPRAFS